MEKHLRCHFYQFASCVRIKIFCFFTDLVMLYWRFNCSQYIEIQFCYILLKIIDSFLLVNSFITAWALCTREILGLGFDVVIHTKPSGFFKDRTPKFSHLKILLKNNFRPWEEGYKLGSILDQHLIPKYSFSASQLPKGIIKIEGLRARILHSQAPSYPEVILL